MTDHMSLDYVTLHGLIQESNERGDAVYAGTIFDKPFYVLAREEQCQTIDSDYASLRYVLDDAFAQAATGKGRERHARGNPFEEQHMQTISRLLGSDDGMAFQAIKKLTEGLDMTDPAARKRELLGAINYIAGIIIYHDMRLENVYEFDGKSDSKAVKS